jgi:hypothetical protein
MSTQRRGKRVRISPYLVTEIFNPRSDHATQGVTQSVSQEEASIKTRDWLAFRVDDETVVTFFLPPIFTGQDETIGLRGTGIITRIDEDNEAIALKFAKALGQFEKIRALEIAGKSRYKKVSYYLSALSKSEFSELAELNPRGFVVEESQRPFDDNVVFQFNTELLDTEHVTHQPGQSTAKANMLDARVIEIKKRKSDSAANIITIGRSSVNDIVLYNRMVSKSHAYMIVHPSGTPCYLIDSASKNGTLLNGRYLKPYGKYRLADRDQIRFGSRTRLVYFSSTGFKRFLDELRNP